MREIVLAFTILVATTSAVVAGLGLSASEPTSAAALFSFVPAWLGWLWQIPEGLGALLGAVIGLGGVAWATSRSYRHLIRSQEHQARLAREREERAHAEQQLRLVAALIGELNGLRAMSITYVTAISSMLDDAAALARKYPSKKRKLSLFMRLPTPLYAGLIGKMDLLPPEIVGGMAIVYTHAQRLDREAQRDPLLAIADLPEEIGLIKSQFLTFQEIADAGIAPQIFE